MMIKQRCSHGGHIWILTFTAVLLIFNTSLFAAEKTGIPKESGYEIFSLKHISVEQGKKYLSGMIAGTVTHFPDTSALLVTPELNKLTDVKYELAKAKAILELVDGPEQYIVKDILPVSAARNMPSNEQLALKLTDSITRGVSIGSFSNPPDEKAYTKAIIDIHNDAVIAIVPVRMLNRLVSVIGQSQNSATITAQNIPKSQDKLESPAKTIASVEPSEAKFLFTAGGEVETEPNSDAAVVKQEQETPKPSVNNQDEDTKSSINEEQVVNLALAERQKLTVGEFLGLVGPYLGMTFMFDEKDVTDEVTINPHGKFRGPIKVKDLYPLLEEVLKFKNLAMTRGEGNFVMIAPAANALDIDPALLETKEDKVGLGDGIVQRIIKLEHINTTTAKTFLDGMKLTTNIIEIPETKTIILTAYARRMARIQALLDIIDKPGEPKKFRFRQLQYTMATTLAPKLQSLAEQLGTLSITVAATDIAPTAPTIPPKRPTETAAQYQARVRTAQQAATRRAAAMRTQTAAQAQEPTLPTVYLDADERTNRILMIGLDEQLDDVEELISTLDVVQQDLRSLEIYKIHHVDAEEVKMQLEELGIISPSLTSPYSSYPSRITSGAKPPTTPQTTAAQQRQSTLSRTQTSELGEAPMEEPQVIVVEPTNSLLVNATAEQHVKIAEILSHVDVETDQQEIRYKLYPLENQSPDHLAEILRPLIEERVLDKEGKVESVRQKQEELITIVPDPNTFSLIVNASKKNQEWIKSLVEQLDVRRPQVLIDVTLVEISESDIFDYDLQAVTKFPRFEPGGQMDKISALLPTSPVPADSGGFPSDRVTELGAFVGGALGGQGFYADTHIQALLTLMEKKGYGRVLAKPKILVNDNELGHIDATNTIYVSRSSSSATTGGEAVISSSYTFDEFPSGIQLDITPHISKGNLLRLEITMARSSQGTPSGGENVPPPPKIENNIETTVTVPDKSTIILGGIIQLDQQKQAWKVPLLGDIPLVGGLFRKIGNTSNDTRLYVFVKGEILRPDETLAGLPDLEQISERNKIAFEKFEERFQSYQDWPGIAPKPVKPFKVLEAQ